MRRIFILVLCSLLIWSCTQEQIGDSTQSDGSRLIPVEFVVNAWAEPGVTRSSINASEDAIKNINLFAYYDGNLESSVYIEDPQSVSIDMFTGRTYNLYALANTGEVTAPAAEEEIQELRYSIGSVSDVQGGLPMSWSQSGYTVSTSPSKVSITLTRLFSKINFRVDFSSMSDFTITAVRLRQAALSVTPFSTNSKVNSSDDVADGDYASASDITSLNDGGTISFYALENCQGVLLPDNDDPWLKNPDEIDETSELCTYLEMTGTYNGTYYGEDITSDQTKFRFFLGEDSCTDFNVVRNSEVTISLEATEDYLFDNGWKVEFGGYLPTIVYALECSASSLSIEMGSSSSVTATYYRTADGVRNWESDYTSYVTWTSSNTSVATVSKGKITAKGPGTATITATLGTRKASVAVTVTQTGKYLTSLSLEFDQDEYYAGDYVYCTATAEFSDGSTENVTDECSWDCWDDCLGTSTPGVFIAGQSDESGTFEIYAEYTYKGITESDSRYFDVIYATDGISVSSSSVGWQSGSLTVTINDPESKGWSFTSDDDHFTMSGGSSGSGNASKTLTYDTVYYGGSFTIYVHIGSKTYSATITRAKAPSNTYSVDYWCYATLTSAVNSNGDSGPGAAQIYFYLADKALQDMTVYDNHGNSYTIKKGEHQSEKKTISFDYMPYDDLVPDFIYGESISPSTVTTYDEYYGIVIYSYGFDY